METLWYFVCIGMVLCGSGAATMFWEIGDTAAAALAAWFAAIGAVGLADPIIRAVA